MELLSNRSYLRVLYALRRKPLRFVELQKELGLNPAQVDRALKALRKELWIVPRVVPSKKGRMLIEYEIGKKGLSFLEAFKSFSSDLVRRKAQLGESVKTELQGLAR